MTPNLTERFRAWPLAAHALFESTQVAGREAIARAAGADPASRMITFMDGDGADRRDLIAYRRTSAAWGIGALCGVRYSDMCAFRAIDRDALERLQLHEMTCGWNIEMQMRAACIGLRILEVPLPYRRGAGAESKAAGSLRGTLRAGSRTVATFCRVARDGS